MCRSIANGGRRCKYHDDPRIIALQSARQASKRMEERLSAAEANGISDDHLERRVGRLVEAHERTHQREQAVAAAGSQGGHSGPQGTAGNPGGQQDTTTDSADGRQPLGEARPSRASEITADRVNSMDWDELADLGADLDDDPDAWDRLETLVNEREAREAEEASQAQQDDFNAWLTGGSTGGDDPVTNPAARSSRKLTPHERAREEYDSYVASQYDNAENEIGFMLNKEGRAKGIDAYSLFSGPVSRAKKYGSEELQAWFGRNGRQTLASYRHSIMGWASDRKAAERARTEGFANVANV